MSNYKARFSIDWARWLIGATFWGATERAGFAAEGAQIPLRKSSAFRNRRLWCRPNGFDLFLGPIRFRLSPDCYSMEDHNLALKKAISYSLKNDWKNHD